MEEWYQAYLQMLKVYAIQPEVLSNNTETLELSGSEIPSGITVMVKKGSTLPIDRPSKMANAIQLAQFGMIDPGTLFEEMGYANGEKRVQALYQWLQLTGKIVPQQGQVQGQQSGQQSDQLDRLNQMLSNPDIKNLPPEEQQAILTQGRQALEQIKAGQ